MDNRGEKKHIVIVLPTLGPGGTERSFIELANHISATARVTLLVISSADMQLARNLHAAVDIRNLGKKRVRFSIFILASVFSELSPNVIVSALPHVNVVVTFAQFFSKVRCPLVVSERNLPLRVPSKRARDWLLMKLKGVVYRRAQVVVAVSNGVKGSLIRDSGLAPGRIAVIRNQVRTLPTLRNASDPWSGPSSVGRVVTVGSLSKKKNHEFLLRAFQILESRKSVQLAVLGRGPERENLQNLSMTLGVDRVVTFQGYVEEVSTWVSNADVFVMTSLVEGDSNALLEAVALGKQIVCTEADGSSRETLGDYEGARIVPDGDLPGFVEALDCALELRARETEFAGELDRPDPRLAWMALLDSLSENEAK